ncbi:hypothetical protein FOL47_010383 [Perkinsus chesapeaki]|uniref:Uncharacterized protein n=1 Tax=Perkinsus chesapeaki TaxID=330153 RepID=A0A7J6N1K4_PERCH|nr:hypothetical protein FOL47_010383 [Perkinsus chesapeaki]
MLAKPINADAQRVLAIMDELKGRTTFLTLITQQVLDGLQGEGGGGAIEHIGQDFVKKFSEQIRLEDLYVMLNTNSDGTIVNTQLFCGRVRMKAAPGIITELRRLQDSSQRPVALLQLLRTLAGMQDVILKRITTTVEEERSRQDIVAHYLLRERAASDRKAKLESKLSHVDPND